MPAILSNNSTSRLAVSINSTELQISVSAGDGAKFPALSGADWFPLTLIKESGSVEILKATARNGDVITVERAQDGSTPQAFTAGDRVELRLTAGVMNGKMETTGGVMTGPLTLTADLTTYRPGAPTTGAVLLGNSGSSYIFFDGASYSLGGAGTIWSSSNFNPANYLPLGGVGGTYGATKGGDGGDGGRAVSDYGPGSFGVGGVLTVTVPTGGNGGAGQAAGAKGTNGAVYISWT